MSERCEHFAAIRPATPHTRGGEECLALGAKWIQLRAGLIGLVFLRMIKLSPDDPGTTLFLRLRRAA